MASGVGVGTSVRWPAGNGARGNEGVSEHRPQHAGRDRLCRERLRRGEPPVTTQIRNKAGNFVRPEHEAFNAAAAAADWTVPNFAADTIDLPARMCGRSPRRPTSCCRPTRRREGRGAAATRCASSTGPSATAATASRLEYIPLPTRRMTWSAPPGASAIKDPRPAGGRGLDRDRVPPRAGRARA
jgi:phosphate transport system substrate-binding protein